MNEDATRSAIALLVIVGFFGLVLVILLGLVDVREPTLAKLVGLLMGYVTAMLNPIVMRYFRDGGAER
jgi:hypothetical protein